MDRLLLDQIDKEDPTRNVPMGQQKQDSFFQMRQDHGFNQTASDGIFMNDSFTGNDAYGNYLKQQPGLPEPFPHLQAPGDKTMQPAGGQFSQVHNQLGGLNTSQAYMKNRSKRDCGRQDSILSRKGLGMPNFGMNMPFDQENSVRSENDDTLSNIFGNLKENSIFNDKMSMTRSRKRKTTKLDLDFKIEQNDFAPLAANNGIALPQNRPKPTQVKNLDFAPIIQPQGGLFANPASHMVKKRSYHQNVTADLTNNLQKLPKREAINALKAPIRRNKNVDQRNEKGGQLGITLIMFANGTVEERDVEQLTSDEKLILQSLLKRKFNIEIDYKWQNEKIVETMNKDSANAKTKRLEENYKLVFKKGLKFQLNAFKKTNRLRCKKSELELQFFDHYFKRVCEANGETMESFLMAPQGSKNTTSNLFNPRTINSKYVSNVSKSELFLEHFTQYLNNDFIEDYHKTVEFKINKVIEKCLELTGKKKSNSANVKKYIEDNPKCKLPWSMKELNNAKLSVLDLINKRHTD